MANPTDSRVPAVDYSKVADLGSRAAGILISNEGYESVRKLVAAALDLLVPGQPMGTELFLAMARVGINVAVEMVCVRRNSMGLIEVYLTKRASDDPAFPDEWHAAGSFYRSGEQPEDVIRRLEEKEFGCKLVGTPRQVDTCHPRPENMHLERGHIISEVWTGAVPSEQGKGEWFPYGELPGGPSASCAADGVVMTVPGRTVYSHREWIIPAAVKAFLAEEGMTS